MPRVKMDHFINQAKAILDATPDCAGNTIFARSDFRRFSLDKSKIMQVYGISFFIGKDDGKCDSVEGTSIPDALSKMQERLDRYVNLERSVATEAQ